MKLLTLLGLLAVGTFATTGVSQGVKKDEIKFKKDGITYDMDDLEKPFGIKLKVNDVKVEQRKNEGDTLITITLEFTKDVTQKNLATVRNFFAGKPFGTANSGLVLRCYFFDENNIA